MKYQSDSITPKGGMSVTAFIPLGPAILLIASAILRGAYYPVYQHVLFIFTVVLFLTVLSVRDPIEKRSGPGFIGIWTALLAAVAMLSSVWSAVPVNSISSAYVYVAYALFIFAFSYTWQKARLKQWVGLELWLLLFAVAGTLVAMTGITGFVLKIYPWSMSVGGMVVAASSLEYPNGLAVYSLMTLAPTLYLIGSTSGKMRIIMVAMAVIQTIGILLAFSKTGYLFLAILSIYFALRLRSFDRRPNYLLVVILAVIILILIFAAGAFNGWGIADMARWIAFDISIENIGTHRMATWKGSINAWLDRPWLGWGIGSYDSIYPGYALDTVTRHAHTIFLHSAAEMGVFGLAIFIILYAYCLRLVYLTIIMRNREGKDGIYMALAFSCLVFLLNNLWDFTFYIPAITLLFMAQAVVLRILVSHPESH